MHLVSCMLVAPRTYLWQAITAHLRGAGGGNYDTTSTTEPLGRPPRRGAVARRSAPRRLGRPEVEVEVGCRHQDCGASDDHAPPFFLLDRGCYILCVRGLRETGRRGCMQEAAGQRGPGGGRALRALCHSACGCRLGGSLGWSEKGSTTAETFAILLNAATSTRCPAADCTHAVLGPPGDVL